MQNRGYRVDRVSVVGMYGVVEYLLYFCKVASLFTSITTHQTLGASASTPVQP